MLVSFSVAHITVPVPRGFCDGWAVVRHQKGEPNQYVSRIFLQENEAAIHAERLRAQERAEQAKRARQLKVSR